MISRVRMASAVALLVGTFLSTGAYATPYMGSILNNSQNYSVIHYGNHGSGNAPRDEWLWFDTGQSISFDFDGSAITSSVSQTFGLTASNGDTAQVTFTAINLSVVGGVAGTISYILSDYTGAGGFVDAAGVMGFGPMGTGALGTFNSSGFAGDVLLTTIWGGDGNYPGTGPAADGIGIDLKFTGVAVPEPGTLALLLAGLFSVALLRSRRSNAG